MSRFLIYLVVLILPAGCLAAEAEWMWSEGDRQAKDPAEFQRVFRLGSLPDGEVQLRALCDFCACEVFLNGNPVLRLEPFDPAGEVAVKRLLVAGENRIVVRAMGVDGPSAIGLDLVGDNGEAIVASGAGWQGGGSISPMGERRLGSSNLSEIGALDEYNQWKEAKDGEAQFSPLPDGFELERLRVAKPGEGSWISMAFDPHGRLVISKEQRGLLRLDLASGEATLIEDTLLEVRGLLFAYGALYANANNSKGLYRLRDADGDGHFEEVQLLMKTEGGVGHGRNDLALGPDGMIYSIHGDSVKLPDGIVRHRPRFGEPGREQGYLIRFDADGNHRELMVTGLRNPYGIAFNPEGEAFTYDADNEGDIGLPLYRPARVNHLVSGANFGWQQGERESWPVYHPHSLPTTHDAGRGSPTAVAFGTNSKFPPRYRDALYILDWAYGRIIALDVIPLGASYVCRSHTFLRGRPLNVTDIAFGPDGAMYFITGGRGTQSALYRIRYSGEPVARSPKSTQESAREEFSTAARALRRTLEEGHGRPARDRAVDAAPYASHHDPWIRHAAMVALGSQREHAPVADDIDLSGSQPIGFKAMSRHEKLEVCLSVLESASQDSDGILEACFPDGDAAVDREISVVLAIRPTASIVEKLLAKLAEASSQPERLHYLNVLSRAGAGWTPDGRRAFFAAIQHPEYFRGDRNMPTYLQGIRERAIATLSEAERAALGDLIEPAQNAVPLPPPRPLVQHWTLAELDLAAPPGYRHDPARGRAKFEQALCSRCHQVGAIGTPVGPDLSAVAGRFSRRDLIEAIVDPSKAMAEIFRPVVITKHDGTIVAGRVVRDDFRESTISISANPFSPSELTVVPKADIASSEPSSVSPMPPGLLDGFSRDEIFQLLDFLEGIQH